MNRFSYILYFSFLILILSTLQAKIIRISDENMYNEALRSNEQLIVEFSADWCSVCNNIKKPFEEIAAEDEFGNVTFAQVDVDKLDSVSKQNGVVGVPTFVYLEKGNKKVEEIGVQNMPTFKEHLRDNLRKTFKVVQNAPSDAGMMQQDPTMADITDQDVSTDAKAAEEPNFFARIVDAVTSFFMFIIVKIKDFFLMIINAIKGFFGK